MQVSGCKVIFKMKMVVISQWLKENIYHHETVILQYCQSHISQLRTLPPTRIFFSLGDSAGLPTFLSGVKVVLDDEMWLWRMKLDFGHCLRLLKIFTLCFIQQKLYIQCICPVYVYFFQFPTRFSWKQILFLRASCVSRNPMRLEFMRFSFQ